MAENLASLEDAEFLAGAGEMGALIRAHDWAATPLGPLHAWPQSLRTAAAILLRSPVPLVLLWGEDGVMLYNAAYSVVAAGRHPELLGSKVREGWPEVADFNDNVMRVGLAGGTLSFHDQELTLLRNGRPEQVFMNLDYSPVPGESGRPEGVLAIVVETSERVRTERRQAFQLQLKEQLRDLPDPRAVMERAVEALGSHLGANRVGYSEVQADDETIVLASCYADRVHPLTGTFKLDAFGPHSIVRQRTGQMDACDDVLADPRQVHATWEAIDTRAFVSVPLIRGGRFTASLYVNFREPHAWAPEELSLIEDVAARTWEAVERARAETALRESEGRFQLTTDAVPQIVWITDAEGRAEYFNRQWTEYTGASYQPTSAAHIAASFIHPDDQGPTLAAFDEARRTGDVFEIEHRIRSKTGEYHWFLVRADPYRDPTTGEIVRWYGSSTDIDGRKAAEATLRESEEQLRLATEAAEVGLWDLDPQSDKLFWPPRIKAMFGISADRPISMADFYAGLHPGDAQATADAFAAALDPNKRALYDVEYRTIGKEDGVLRWVAAKGRGVFDAEGNCTRVIGTAMDITSRKAVEEQLRELNETLETRVAERTAELVKSERRFRGIFDSALQFMALLAPDGTVIEVNQTALAWSEIEPQDIIGKPFWRAAPMRDNPTLEAAIKTGIRRAAAGLTVREEHEMRGAGEVRAFVDFSLKPVPGENGEPMWLVAEGRDITDLQRAQDALRQAQKMEAVGQLTGGLAHDFNNLLGAVVGSFDLIRRKPSEAERVKRWAEHGMAAAERGAKLTGQLLAFSRAQRLQKKPVVVSNLVEGMGDLLERTLGPMVRLKLDLSGNGAALSDPTQLEMAVLNLAINARDAMLDGGELTIATTSRRIGSDTELSPGDYIEVAVTDTGTGMPPEVVARAFDPFFTTKGVGKGTGLGLSQVYGVARQTGGTVRIESRPDKGTTVRILLPTSTAPAQADGERGSVGEVAAGPTATVLVVDDDPEIRRVLVDLLDALGYGVVEASDGPSGLAELERNSPDLMMVDFAMPGMNGAEVAKAARERRPDLPVVFASGYADTAAIEKVAGSEAVVLRKPFRVDELQAVLNSLLT